MASNRNRNRTPDPAHPSDAAAADEQYDEAAAGPAALGDVTPADGFTPTSSPPRPLADLAPEELTPAGAAPLSGGPPQTPLPGVTVAPPALEAGGSPSGDNAALLARIDRLEKLLAQSAAAGTVAPPGYKLVPDAPARDAEAESQKERFRAELDRGLAARTQDRANALFPEGKHVWRCVLPDKNGHPEILIRASNPTDAAARYLAACGVNSTEHKVTVVRA